MTGPITCSERASACQSVQSATRSPFQKRLRDRRMYQFERSSTKESNARITPGVQYRSYCAVMSATSCSVRSPSQRSSGCSSPGGSASGRKPSTFA
jgi:hypothetical protein